jgi:hypothetical protein
MVVGTPEYMSPELIMGRPFDGRVDQYALAVTVYEMLAGRRPFDGTTATAILVMQTTEECQALCQVEPRIPRGVSDAVARALAKDPARRFASCAEFAQAVVSAAGATPSNGARSPSDNAVRTDQVRLPCPSCQRNLVLPARLLEDLDAARTKKLACPSCLTRVRLSGDGRALVSAEGDRETGVFTPRPAPAEPTRGTTRESAPRTPTEKTPRPGATAATPSRSHTMIEDAVIDTTPPEPLPLEPTSRRLPPWALGAGLAAAILVTGILVLGYSATGSRQEKPAQAVVTAPIPIDVRLPAAPALFPSEPKQDAEVTRRPESSNPPSQAKAPDDPPPPPAPEVRVAAVTNSRPATGISAKKRAEVPRRPEPSSVIFEPVPDSTPLEKESLPKVLADPDLFAQKIVIPTGLHVLGSAAQQLPDGTIVGTVARTRIHYMNAQKYAVLEPPSEPQNVVIQSELAERLRELKALTINRVGKPHLAATFGDNAASLTLHVQKRVEGSDESWVPVVNRIEFLLALDPVRIAETKYSHSFKTLTISATEQRVGASTNAWSDKIGQPYIGQLRRALNYIKNVKFSMEMQHLDSQLGRAVSDVMSRTVDPAKILDQRLRSTAR